MSALPLQFAREQMPELRNAPDNLATLYLGDEHPEMLEIPQFRQVYALRQEQEALHKGEALNANWAKELPGALADRVSELGDQGGQLLDKAGNAISQQAGTIGRGAGVLARNAKAMAELQGTGLSWLGDHAADLLERGGMIPTAEERARAAEGDEAARKLWRKSMDRLQSDAKESAQHLAGMSSKQWQAAAMSALGDIVSGQMVQKGTGKALVGLSDALEQNAKEETARLMGQATDATVPTMAGAFAGSLPSVAATAALAATGLPIAAAIAVPAWDETFQRTHDPVEALKSAAVGAVLPAVDQAVSRRP